MTTLTITKARQKLGFWLRKASQGEDIGIIDGDTIIALRPVKVESTDYAAREYGVSEPELDRFVKRGQAEITRERKAGKLKTYKGSLHALLGD
jgi:antitoxin (DNA-binding transcriptional repressor) of toxin-antitoxin stability system